MVDPAGHRHLYHLIHTADSGAVPTGGRSAGVVHWGVRVDVRVHTKLSRPAVVLQ